MRQGIVVSGLLCLIAIPTVLFTDGLHGFSPRWPASVAGPVAGSRPVGAATGQRAANEALVAAAAFARGASRIRVGANAGGSGLPIVGNSVVAGPDTSNASDFATNLHSVEASIKTANVAATNMAIALDYKSAVKWYALASDPGNAEARYGIAQDFLGAEPDPDFASAAHWLLSAAELDHARAQLDLAGMYVEGTGVERNYAAAFMWYTLAQWGLTSETDRAAAADQRNRLARAMTPEEQADADRMIRDRAIETAALAAAAPGPAAAEAGAAVSSASLSPPDQASLP